VLDELVDLVEGALVEQGIQALTRRQLAGFVLSGHGTLGAGVQSLVPECPELLYARFGAQYVYLSSTLASTLYDSWGDTLATPYFQLRREEVASTQDVARAGVGDLPLLVIAGSQTRGRGRSGAHWENADRALAVSLAFHHEDEDRRPFSLMAGLAAVRAIGDTELKWPNDVLRQGLKVGGILVERNEETTVIGLGLNLWWPEAPDGAGAIFDTDPGPSGRDELGALWGAELMELIDAEGWPVDAYRLVCSTLGREITWEPDGSGTAVDVTGEGHLVVDTPQGRREIYSGAISQVRTSESG
jgi:BirA family biotin operon repressor/biotin-[acetyl-CoA-carboxylase] ligase